jgi:O-antigen/teichoic acid export membrane protein
LKINKNVVLKGATYIYIETIASIISGYIFWIIMSKIATTETIGISSTLVSFAAIVSVVASIGIPTGVQRFIGKYFSENKLDDAKAFVITSLILICIGILVCSIMILIAQNWLYGIFGFEFGLIIISILLMGSAVISMLFRSIVISSLNTKSLPMIIITSSIFKLFLSILLVLMGTGAIGLTLGLAFNHILSSILLGILVINVFKRSRINYLSIKFIDNCKNLLRSSVVYWIPFLITVIGSQLGTIVVFGSQGSNQAAVYFLALTIVTGLTSVMNSLFSIAIPALSALQDYRKRFAWQTIRLSAILLLPFSCSLIFYSEEIMRLIGDDYVKGSSFLEILLLSMLPMAILGGVNALVYSYGNYRQVLLIGLAMSIPRTILYFILVPTYGGTGAAISYTIGSLIGCVISIIISKKIGMLIFWKDLAAIFIIPTTIAFVLNYLELNYIIGILTTIVISYVILLKIHIITRSDILDSLDILPERVSNQFSKLINKFKD